MGLKPGPHIYGSRYPHAYGTQGMPAVTCCPPKGHEPPLGILQHIYKYGTGLLSLWGISPAACVWAIPLRAPTEQLSRLWSRSLLWSRHPWRHFLVPEGSSPAQQSRATSTSHDGFPWKRCVLPIPQLSQCPPPQSRCLYRAPLCSPDGGDHSHCRDGPKAARSSPSPSPPRICSPFPSPSAPCTCTPRRSGIYPAPGARCEGSALINLAGTASRASCLAHAHGDSIRVPGTSGWCPGPPFGPAPILVGPGHGVVAEDGLSAPLPAPSPPGNPGPWEAV